VIAGELGGKWRAVSDLNAVPIDQYETCPLTIRVRATFHELFPPSVRIDFHPQQRANIEPEAKS
jgi:hypothetical protein